MVGEQHQGRLDQGAGQRRVRRPPCPRQGARHQSTRRRGRISVLPAWRAGWRRAAIGRRQTFQAGDFRQQDARSGAPDGGRVQVFRGRVGGGQPRQHRLKGEPRVERPARRLHPRSLHEWQHRLHQLGDRRLEVAAPQQRDHLLERVRAGQRGHRVSAVVQLLFGYQGERRIQDRRRAVLERMASRGTRIGAHLGTPLQTQHVVAPVAALAAGRNALGPDQFAAHVCIDGRELDAEDCRRFRRAQMRRIAHAGHPLIAR